MYTRHLEIIERNGHYNLSWRAYHRIAFAKEGDPVIEWLNNHGITAILLKYRLPSDSIMTDKSIVPCRMHRKPYGLSEEMQPTGASILRK